MINDMCLAVSFELLMVCYPHYGFSMHFSMIDSLLGSRKQGRGLFCDVHAEQREK